MFDVVRKLTQRNAGTSKREPSTEAASPGGSTEVRVLAVTQSEDDWKALHEVAGKCGWTLFWAHSCDAALTVLSHHIIPVVIYDRDLPGEEWKVVLKRISLFRQPLCVLLASSVADEYLWREVVQHQGFDVLPKPFQPDRLIRMVNVAWSWRGWMHGPSTGNTAGG